MLQKSPLSPDRFFSAEPLQRKIARQLYDSVFNLPLICPFMNYGPFLQARSSETFLDPFELIVLSDEYLVNRLRSQGFLPETNAAPASGERNPANRKNWQYFVDNAVSLHGMPAEIWISEILYSVFGIKEKLASKNALRIYDTLVEALKQPEFQFARLLERFNVEAIGVVDLPADPHLEILKSGPGTRVLPCFNPDPLFRIQAPGWVEMVTQLAKTCQIPIDSSASFIHILEKQSAFFKSLGATTVTQLVNRREQPYCSRNDLDAIFQRAMLNEASADDAARFSSQMLLEMAAICSENSLVLHLRQPGVNVQTASLEPPDLSSGLKNMLGIFGRNPSITLVLSPNERMPLESLKYLSDSYPSLKLGSPEWYFTGLTSMQKYYGSCLESIGLHKSAGLTNRCTSFLAIPAQHDIWRRAGANWLSGLVVCGLVDLDIAYEMVYGLAYGQAKAIYKL